MGEGMLLQILSAEGGTLLQISGGRGPYLLQTDSDGSCVRPALMHLASASETRCFVPLRFVHGSSPLVRVHAKAAGALSRPLQGTQAQVCLFDGAAHLK